jgi:type IV pilus biogenesis protein PilP
MSQLIRWWPAYAATLASCALVWAMTVTSVAKGLVAPLPDRVRMASVAPGTKADDGERRLFGQPPPAEARAPAEAAAQPPVLVGIAGGRGTIVALLKTADGQTVQARAGDLVGGWTVRSITSRKVVVGNSESQQDLMFAGEQK